LIPDADDGKEVLGSLPRHRPSIESPRRAKARAAARPRPEAETPSVEDGGTRSQLGELERLALASAKLAGGAAATGLKLAGRAVGGLGRVVGRR
jgi:hypothetical protein